MRRRLTPLLLFLLALALYLATLAPTVVTIFDDSLELQVALPTFAIVHPTGYPLYTLLGWLTAKLIPFGDAAYRVNLFSALAASAAIAFVALVARRLGSAVIPTITAALLLAVSPVWWSQATIAEVYALQGLLTLLVLYALLRWDEAKAVGDGDNWLVVVALAIGLGLTHHRLTLLLLPGAVVFVLWGDPGLLRRPRAWVKPLLALLAPLLLYAILPLRAHVGSLDGAYDQAGFWDWVLGGGYSTFLRDNPFGIERNFSDLIQLLVDQYGLLGILTPFLGFMAWRMQPRRFTLLALIAVTNLLFASQYKVADIEVFLIPLFIVWALFIAVGLTAAWDSALIYLLALLRRLPVSLSPRLPASLLTVMFLLWPLALISERLPAQDRSQPPTRAWGVHDYGVDMLSSIEPDGSVVGILGEMTLLRYFQRTQSLRGDVQTIAADAEPARLEAIAASLETGRPTYTTRPLSGLAERYRLSAAGPLVRVEKDATTTTNALANQVDIHLTPEVKLIGWDIDLRQPRSGPSARLQLAWQTDAVPPADFKVSARLLTPGGALLAQTDDIPVHNTYPPTRWRMDEIIIDSYDLALADVPTTPLLLQIILYDPQDGTEMNRWEQQIDLKSPIPPDSPDS